MTANHQYQCICVIETVFDGESTPRSQRSLQYATETGELHSHRQCFLLYVYLYIHNDSVTIYQPTTDYGVYVNCPGWGMKLSIVPKLAQQRQGQQGHTRSV